MTMTYYSSTFSSTSSNPPIQIAGGLGMQSTAQETGTLGWLHGNKVWFYSSTNAPADLAGVNAITDGKALGMKPGDVILGVCASGGSTVGYAYLMVVNPSSAGANDVSTAGVTCSVNANT